MLVVYTEQGEMSLQHHSCLVELLSMKIETPLSAGGVDPVDPFSDYNCSCTVGRLPSHSPTAMLIRRVSDPSTSQSFSIPGHPINLFLPRPYVPRKTPMLSMAGIQTFFPRIPGIQSRQSGAGWNGVTGGRTYGGY